MKKFALLVVSLFAAGSALYARKPAPVIPDFIHAAYSVESLLSEAELTNPGYDAFQFIYLMATPEWPGWISTGRRMPLTPMPRSSTT